jgi:glyoxylase-like metal-dependent hydrolase (beta-lactamase superfamily II)
VITIHAVTGGGLSENGHIVSAPSNRSVDAFVFDPGYNSNAFINYARFYCLRIKAIFLTHAHIDHVSKVEILSAAFACPVYLHEADVPLPELLNYTLSIPSSITAKAMVIFASWETET